MFEQAFKRLFLALLPLFFIALAFFLISMESQKQTALPATKPQSENCHLLLGVSPFPKRNIENQISNSGASSLPQFKKSKLKALSGPSSKLSPPSAPLPPASFLGESYFLTKEQLLKSVKSVENLIKEKTFFVWPLVLNKEEKWIISAKAFFILPSGERKEISHLTYEEILSLQKKSSDSVLTLDTALLYSPKKSHFLFRLLGSDRKKIIKNLDKALSKARGAVYISSENERLLAELKTSSFQSHFKILHSYKSLIRLEMLSVFPRSAFPLRNFTGDGALIPEIFSSINWDAIALLKQKAKLLFFEKEPPYTKQDRIRLKNASALISSEAQESLRHLPKKRNCFLKQKKALDF